MSKHTIKVLPIPWWVNNHFDECTTIESNRRLNHNGWFYDRSTKESWIEFNGQSKVYDKDRFLYELEQLNHMPLSDKDITTIQSMIDMNLDIIPKRELYHILGRETDRRGIRNIERRVLLNKKRVLSKYTNGK